MRKAKIKNISGVLYKMIYDPNHPKSDQGYVHIHILKAERALGKPLPSKAHVHHADGNSLKNKNSNLVICENNSYHRLLHGRLTAFKATGDPRKKKCYLCKSWEGVMINRVQGTKTSNYHKECWAKYNRNLRQRKTAYA